jgi:hypothetical protein
MRAAAADMDKIHQALAVQVVAEREQSHQTREALVLETQEAAVAAAVTMLVALVVQVLSLLDT